MEKKSHEKTEHLQNILSFTKNKNNNLNASLVMTCHIINTWHPTICYRSFSPIT